jgi:ADP-ribose pyrophosphatase
VSQFSIVDRETILQSFVFDVERRTIQDGLDSFTRDVAIHPGAVAIVAVNDNGDVGLVQQYRATLDVVNLEIPAGTCDIAGEDSLSTAKRELLEEIGGTSDRWTLLTKFFNSSGWTNQTTIVYLAEQVSIGTPSPEGPEERGMTVLWKSQSEIRTLLAGSQPLDGTAAIGLYAWLNRQP